MRTRFQGFPAEAFSFFRGLEKNNNRDWFQARKEEFDTQVMGPMKGLVDALNDEFSALAPDFVTPAARAIYRIYRDTRFSADKTPYKTHIGATFHHQALSKHDGAGFYFSVSHKGIEVAGGVYMPGPESLLAIRKHLAGQHAEFRKLAGKPALRELLGELQGDQLKRVPKGFPAEHPAEDLLRHKQWYLYKVFEPELAAKKDLLPFLTKAFRMMLPMMEFLNTPVLEALRKKRRDPLKKG